MNPLARGVDVQALAARAGQEDPERRRLAGGAEALLAGRQRAIDPAALDRAGHPLRDHLQQDQILRLAEGAGGGGEIPRRRPGVRPPGRGPGPARDLRRARPAARPARPGTGGCSAAATSRPASGWPGRRREEIERHARVLRDVAERSHLGRVPLVGQLDRSRRPRPAGSSRRGRRRAEDRPPPAPGGSPRRSRWSEGSGGPWRRSPPPDRR